MLTGVEPNLHAAACATVKPLTLDGHDCDETAKPETPSTSVDNGLPNTSDEDQSTKRSEHQRLLPYRKTKTRWRKRPTDEIKYLRAQVAKLEELLETLGYRCFNEKLTNEEETSEVSDRDGMYWKYRANSHNRNMKAALMENRKLRMMVESRLRVAKAFQCAIDNHVRLLARKLPWPTGESVKGASDELIFALLDEEKEYQYAATDEMLESSGIARINYQTLPQLQLAHNSNGVWFHHAEVRVLSSSKADVARAIRNCLKQGSRGDPSEQIRCPKLLKGDDYIHAVTKDEVHLPGSQPVEVKARLAQWCVAERDRTVITWSCYVEFDGCRHVRLLQRIWVILVPTRIKKGGAHGQEHRSILRIAVRLTPVETEFDLEKAEHITEMADIVIDSYHRKADIVLRALMKEASFQSRSPDEH